MVNHKKNGKKNVVIKMIPSVAGTLLLTFIFLLTTYMAKRTISQVADETLLYARHTCERYDKYVNDDQAKDLNNLQEKAISIALYEQHGVAIHKDILDAYVADENLTGVVVTDSKGKYVVSSGEDAHILFEKELKNDSVSQILEFPEKSYMERLQIGEKTYDFAVVAREDSAGLILCYHEVVLRPMGVNDISLDTMLSGNQFKMDGMVIITNGEVVLNTNEKHVQGQSVVGCPIEVTDKSAWEAGKITKLKYNGKCWYGKKMRYKQYRLYAVYPSGEVFATRTTILAFSTAVYIFFLLILAFLRNRSAQNTMQEMQKQFRIINAVGSIYKLNILIQLETSEWEIIKIPGEMGAVLKDTKTADTMLNCYIDNFVAKECQEAYRKFVDLKTIVKRLKAKTYIANISRDDNQSWVCSIMTPQSWDAHGNVNAVVLAVRDITADIQKVMSD
ncbi:hypothetical protein KQI72_06695 [Eubacterium sp. MSJ-21]|nr:hypothetical protein [Eubacterium sp. MSJ-21]